jgi:hypothetical protein
VLKKTPIERLKELNLENYFYKDLRGTGRTNFFACTLSNECDIHGMIVASTIFAQSKKNLSRK